MNRTTALTGSTQPGRLQTIIAARQAAAEAAAAQPKRKRKPSPKHLRPASRTAAKRQPVPVVAAPPIEHRGTAQLARLGQELRLAPVVDQRRAELDDIAALMTGRPRPR